MSLFNADEVFKIGIQIENNGKTFYSTAAEKSTDPDLKKLFSELAGWETKHAALFEELRSKIPMNIKEQDIFDPDNEIHLYLKSVADSTIFIKGSEMEKTISSCTSPVDILTKALSFEKESVVFYSSMKEIVPDGLGKADIDKLVLEELYHVGQLTKEIKKLQK
jgi:rubrerythrin